MLKIDIVKKMTRAELIQYCVLRDDYENSRLGYAKLYTMAEDARCMNMLLSFENGMIEHYDTEPPGFR